MKYTLNEKILYISDSKGFFSITPLCFIYCTLTNMSNDGTVIELFKSFGGYGSFEELFTSLENLFSKIDDLYIELRKKCEGVHANSGSAICILHPHLVGILTHEAVIAKNSFLVIDGKIKSAVSETMIAGNLFELLNNISAISKDVATDGTYICINLLSI